jgi:hypothetical protein
VLNVSHDPVSYATVLSVERIQFKSAFDKLEIKMGYTRQTHTFRPHSDLRRRQNIPTPSSLFDPSDLATLPIPTPTATANSNTYEMDVSKQFLNQTIPLPSDIASNMSLVCKDCSTSGKLDISFASFSWDCSGTVTDGIQLSDCLHGGEITVAAHGLGAHVVLDTTLEGDLSFHHTLFTVPAALAIRVRRTFCSTCRK